MAHTAQQSPTESIFIPAMKTEYECVSSVLKQACPHCGHLTIWLYPPLRAPEGLQETILALIEKSPEPLTVWKRRADASQRGAEFLLIQGPVDIADMPRIVYAWGGPHEAIAQTAARCELRYKKDCVMDAGIRGMYYTIVFALPPAMVAYHGYEYYRIWPSGNPSPLYIIAQACAMIGIIVGIRAIAHVWRGIRFERRIRLLS